MDIWEKLSAEKAMVFMAGPRQAGKTTLSEMIGDTFTHRIYFNWDIPRHRAMLIENPAFFEEIERKDATTPMVIFDEIHKYRDWKNYLKGVYDQYNKEFTFLITGSGRLDMYQKGGDSLAGRYFLFHLWPFTVSELGGANRRMDDFLQDPLWITMDGNGTLQEIWEGLIEFSGFPEPYLTSRKDSYRRWSNTYSSQLIREDIRDLSRIQSIHDLETLYYLLPSQIGSPLSVPSLSRDLKVSYNTIQSWLSVFQRFFLTFSLTPWTRKISRAVQKEKKIYLWDTPLVRDDAARFENRVAQELYRSVTLWNDMGLGDFSLHFIKNKEQQEVDFLIALGNQPFLLIEAKISDIRPSPALLKFQTALDVPGIQLVNRTGGFRRITNGANRILIAPAWQWTAMLP